MKKHLLPTNFIFWFAMKESPGRGLKGSPWAVKVEVVWNGMGTREGSEQEEGSELQKPVAITGPAELNEFMAGSKDGGKTAFMES